MRPVPRSSVPNPLEDGRDVVVKHHPFFVLREPEALDLLQLQLRIAARAIASEQDAMRSQAFDRFLDLLGYGQAEVSTSKFSYFSHIRIASSV